MIFKKRPSRSPVAGAWGSHRLSLSLSHRERFWREPKLGTRKVTSRRCSRKSGAGPRVERKATNPMGSKTTDRQTGEQEASPRRRRPQFSGRGDRRSTVAALEFSKEEVQEVAQGSWLTVTWMFEPRLAASCLKHKGNQVCARSRKLFLSSRRRAAWPSRRAQARACAGSVLQVLQIETSTIKESAPRVNT